MQKSTFCILLIIAVNIIAYGNTFANEFVWDENVFVTSNVEIREIGNTLGFFGEAEFGLYRPLRTVLYSVTYNIWGDNTFGYHINSLFWHIIVSVLVFFVVRKLFENQFLSISTALIFAVTPIHIERVTNMTGGFDLMGVFFLLLAFCLYMKKSKWAYLVFVLALFSSEEALTFPLLILIYEILFNKYIFNISDTNKKIVAAFAITGAFIVFRVILLGIGARAAEYPTGDMLSTLLTMPKVFFYYFLLIFFPFKLNLYREISTSTLADPILYISAIILLGLIITTVKYNKNKKISFSILWFFITLIPFSNILPLQALMADRYLYLPSLTAALIYSLGITWLYSKSKHAGIGILAVIVVLFSALTVTGNTEWKDEITLWSIATERSPNTSAVFSNLGFAYDKKGDTEKARENFLKAIDLEEKNEQAHYNLGTIYMKEKEYGKAIGNFEKAISLDANYFKAYDALGLAYYYIALESDSPMEKATEYIKKSIEINPGFSKGYSDLGMIYAQSGEFEAAIQLFEKAIRLDTKNHEAYYNMGILLEFMDDKRAGYYFGKAYELMPENRNYAVKAGKILDG